MPGYDRTGPKGMGPGSGGGFGPCGNNAGGGKNNCRRKGGAGRGRGSGLGQRSGQGRGKQMMGGFGPPEEMILPEEGRFSGAKWFHRRNRT